MLLKQLTYFKYGPGALTSIFCVVQAMTAPMGGAYMPPSEEKMANISNVRQIFEFLPLGAPTKNSGASTGSRTNIKSRAEPPKNHAGIMIDRAIYSSKTQKSLSYQEYIKRDLCTLQGNGR